MSMSAPSTLDPTLDPVNIEGPSHKLLIRPDSNRLLVFFSGTSKSGGRFDFWKSANEQHHNVLLINNGKNEWYQGPIPGFSDCIDETTKRIRDFSNALKCEEIITFGVSMGGYAAILFGCLLNTRVLAFGFDTILRHPLSRSASRMPKKTQAVYKNLRTVIKNSSAEIVAITGDMDFSDLISLSRIADLKNVKASTLRGIAHGVGRHIDKVYGLKNVLDQFIEHNELPTFIESGTTCQDKILSKQIFESYKALTENKNLLAKSILLEALDRSPLSEAANFLFGMVEIELKNYNSAAKYLGYVSGMLPHFHTSKFHLAKALRLGKNYREAQQHYADYLKLRPDSAGAHYSLALIYEKLEKHDSALDMALEALRLAPQREAYQNLVNTLTKETVEAN